MEHRVHKYLLLITRYVHDYASLVLFLSWDTQLSAHNQDVCSVERREKATKFSGIISLTRNSLKKALILAGHLVSFFVSGYRERMSKRGHEWAEEKWWFIMFRNNFRHVCSTPPAIQNTNESIPKPLSRVPFFLGVSGKTWALNKSIRNSFRTNMKFLYKNWIREWMLTKTFILFWDL